MLIYIFIFIVVVVKKYVFCLIWIFLKFIWIGICGFCVLFIVYIWVINSDVFFKRCKVKGINILWMFVILFYLW